jgi:ATP-dependent protease ClpP protease subunit
MPEPKSDEERAWYAAEAAKFDAETRLLDMQAHEAEAKARAAWLNTEKLEREARNVQAQNDRNHVYHFETAVRDTQKVRETLDQWHRLDPNADWTLVMNSPGGSVIDGMALFDHLAAYSLRGGGTHKLTILTRGYSASMAGILAQAADERVMGAESYLMLHKVSTMTGGSLDDIEDEVEFLRMITARVESIFVERSGGKLTKATLRRRWARRDWWVDSATALKFGLADRIG